MKPRTAHQWITLATAPGHQWVEWEPHPPQASLPGAENGQENVLGALAEMAKKPHTIPELSPLGNGATAMPFNQEQA